jgi:4-amino-4-deoxy-L-arabinose transferase-like glycosyltransferase
MAAWLARKPFWTVIVLGLALLLGGDWILPLIDRDEPRFAEASREMRQNSNFIIPYFNGDYRFDKPPLIYWCEAASSAVLGDNDFAARLPTPLFAVATAVLLLLWGRRLGQPDAGFYAALMFLTCLQVLVHGRLAVADMPMIFFFAASVWSGWEMIQPQARPGWWWMLHLSMALGFLAKGPEAFLPWAVAGWMGRQRPGAGKSLVLGGCLTLALVALWGVPALMQTHGEYWRIGIGKHVIHRSLGVMEGHGASGWRYVALLPLFFVTFFASFFPWALWVPGELRRGGEDALGKYLLTQAALVFAVFTLAATKLPHYTLPAFPCLALWLARRAAAPRRWAWGVAAMTCLAAVAIALFPFARSRMLAANLWREAEPVLRPDTQVAALGFEEPSLVWEFRRVVTNPVQFIALPQAAAFLRGPAPRCLVLPTKDWDDARFIHPAGARVVRATGIDTASFKHWDVTAVILDGRP